MTLHPPPKLHSFLKQFYTDSLIPLFRSLQDYLSSFVCWTNRFSLSLSIVVVVEAIPSVEVRKGRESGYERIQRLFTLEIQSFSPVSRLCCLRFVVLRRWNSIVQQHSNRNPLDCWFFFCCVCFAAIFVLSQHFSYKTVFVLQCMCDLLALSLSSSLCAARSIFRTVHNLFGFSIHHPRPLPYNHSPVRVNVTAIYVWSYSWKMTTNMMKEESNWRDGKKHSGERRNIVDR